mmetsp:Transcript_24008/g.77241  ORF Transcript_24008/g.77241 Transcript_24008/m.77241 type:complete len:215 (-) Transcript_24008:50-694(-)
MRPACSRRAAEWTPRRPSRKRSIAVRSTTVPGESSARRYTIATKVAGIVPGNCKTMQSLPPASNAPPPRSRRWTTGRSSRTRTTMPPDGLSSATWNSGGAYPRSRTAAASSARIRVSTRATMSGVEETAANSEITDASSRRRTTVSRWTFHTRSRSCDRSVSAREEPAAWAAGQRSMQESPAKSPASHHHPPLRKAPRTASRAHASRRPGSQWP